MISNETDTFGPSTTGGNRLTSKIRAISMVAALFLSACSAQPWKKSSAESAQTSTTALLPNQKSGNLSRDLTANAQNFNEAVAARIISLYNAKIDPTSPIDGRGTTLKSDKQNADHTSTIVESINIPQSYIGDLTGGIYDLMVSLGLDNKGQPDVKKVNHIEIAELVNGLTNKGKIADTFKYVSDKLSDGSWSEMIDRNIPGDEITPSSVAHTTGKPGIVDAYGRYDLANQNLVQQDVTDVLLSAANGSAINYH